ncbi:prepilin-type N-terminal cleavage/methylation domain-containing protein [Solibacillus silvestris]
MFNTLKKRIKNEKGLSLVELLAVIVILGIVAAIAVPAIGNIIQNSRDRAVLAEASSVLAGAKIAHTEGKCDAAANGGCTGTVLNDYVDGITLTDSTVVTLSGGNWSINYERWGEIPTDSDYTVSGAVTETNLNDLID